MKKYQHEGFTVEAGEGKFSCKHRLEDVPEALWHELLKDQVAKVAILDASGGKRVKHEGLHTIQVFSDKKAESRGSGSIFANYDEKNRLVEVEVWK